MLNELLLSVIRRNVCETGLRTPLYMTTSPSSSKWSSNLIRPPAIKRDISRACSSVSPMSAPHDTTHPPPPASLLPTPPISFVPKHGAPSPDSLRRLIEVLSSSRRPLVLTGAGISTESGIPDYRSEQVGQ